MLTDAAEYKAGLATESIEVKYQEAEKSLCRWIDENMQLGLTIPQLTFILQFRIWDINRLASEPMK